jgi:hypothetical protein
VALAIGRDLDLYIHETWRAVIEQFDQVAIAVEAQHLLLIEVTRKGTEVNFDVLSTQYSAKLICVRPWQDERYNKDIES